MKLGLSSPLVLQTWKRKQKLHPPNISSNKSATTRFTVIILLGLSPWGPEWRGWLYKTGGRLTGELHHFICSTRGAERGSLVS
jgi:hypothetical protein